MVLGISRLADKRKDVISFVRLMKDLEENPQVLSGRRYIGLYASHPLLRESANCTFDRFAVAGAMHVNPKIFAKQKNRLVRLARHITKYRHKRIAHRADRSLRRLPTFEEVNACLDYLEYLLKDYVMLLEATGLTQVLPVWQYDWKQIFRIPWITERRPVPETP